jgi:BlaI family transcriptional regulator, penicillinase repressor
MSLPPATQISDAEAQVMEVLWRSKPTQSWSTEDIAHALRDSQSWQLTTVKTLLNRLLNKGAISAQQDGRRYLYSAALQRETWLRAQSLGLVAHFSAHRKLKAADIRALKKLIEDLEK